MSTGTRVPGTGTGTRGMHTRYADYNISRHFDNRFQDMGMAGSDCNPHANAAVPEAATGSDGYDSKRKPEDTGQIPAMSKKAKIAQASKTKSVPNALLCQVKELCHVVF